MVLQNVKGFMFDFSCVKTITINRLVRNYSDAAQNVFVRLNLPVKRAAYLSLESVCAMVHLGLCLIIKTCSKC